MGQTINICHKEKWHNLILALLGSWLLLKESWLQVEKTFKLEVGRAAKGCRSPIKGCIWGVLPDGQWQFSQERGVGVIFVDELWYVRPFVFIHRIATCNISCLYCNEEEHAN